MGQSNWIVILLKAILIVNVALIAFLSICRLVPEWLIFIPLSPFIYIIIRRMGRG